MKTTAGTHAITDELRTILHRPVCYKSSIESQPPSFLHHNTPGAR